jgi:hypothetical protein
MESRVPGLRVLIKHGEQIIIKGRDYVNNPENKFTVKVLRAVAELERVKSIERGRRDRGGLLFDENMKVIEPRRPRRSGAATPSAARRG